jgi:hypothetical protein
MHAPPPPCLSHLVSTRHAPRFAELSLEPRAYLFAAQENRAFDRVFDGRDATSRFGLLPDCGQL